MKKTSFFRGGNMQRCHGCMREFSDNYEICPRCGYIVNTPPKIKSHLFGGTVLSGRYMVGKVLGHGGFGITYIAWDKKLNRPVAIKEFFPNAFSTRSEGDSEVSCFDDKSSDFFREGVRKMLDEGTRLSRFSDNENIVNIYDCFEENKTAYIVMEYLNGKDLKHYLEERGGRITPEKAIEIILPVINALEDMHYERLIHRDISPDNIFLCDNGKVKLLDFGSARLAVDDSEKSLSIMIKKGYAPIEQYSSHSKQGTWTDVYAVCATLYRMITGSVPTESTARESGRTYRLSDFGITGYDALESVIFKGLEIEVKDRIQTVRELRNALLKAMQQPVNPIPVLNSQRSVGKQKQPAGQRSVSEQAKLRYGIIAAVAVAVAAVIAAGAILIYSLVKKEDSEAHGDVQAETTVLPDDFWGTTSLFSEASSTEAETEAQTEIVIPDLSGYPSVTEEELYAIISGNYDGEVAEKMKRSVELAVKPVLTVKEKAEFKECIGYLIDGRKIGDTEIINGEQAAAALSNLDKDSKLKLLNIIISTHPAADAATTELETTLAATTQEATTKAFTGYKLVSENASEVVGYYNEAIKRANRAGDVEHECTMTFVDSSGDGVNSLYSMYYDMINMSNSETVDYLPESLLTAQDVKNASAVSEDGYTYVTIDVRNQKIDRYSGKASNGPVIRALLAEDDVADMNIDGFVDILVMEPGEKLISVDDKTYVTFYDCTITCKVDEKTGKTVDFSYEYMLEAHINEIEYTDSDGEFRTWGDAEIIVKYNGKML